MAVGILTGVATGTTEGVNFATTLVFLTGILMISFFSSPVEVSFVVTSFYSSSITSTTSCVEF